MTTLKMNVGKLDRAARVVLGVVLVAAGLAYWGALGLGLILIGCIPLATGLTGWCPVYALLGINSCAWNYDAR